MVGRSHELPGGVQHQAPLRDRLCICMGSDTKHHRDKPYVHAGHRDGLLPQRWAAGHCREHTIDANNQWGPRPAGLWCSPAWSGWERRATRAGGPEKNIPFLNIILRTLRGFLIGAQARASIRQRPSSLVRSPHARSSYKQMPSMQLVCCLASQCVNDPLRVRGPEAIRTDTVLRSAW